MIREWRMLRNTWKSGLMFVRRAALSSPAVAPGNGEPVILDGRSRTWHFAQGAPNNARDHLSESEAGREARQLGLRASAKVICRFQDSCRVSQTEFHECSGGIDAGDAPRPQGH